MTSSLFNQIGPSRIYRLNSDVAIEDFDERSLALHCTDLRLVELNATARDLISRLDDRNSLRQIAASVAEDYGRPLEVVLHDALATIAQLVNLDIVERVRPASEETPERATGRLHR